MKQMQLSNSDFKYFIRKDCYYINKSLLIEEILTKQSQALFSPRRSGRTLTLSMLNYYFDMKENNDDKNILSISNLEIKNFILEDYFSEKITKDISNIVVLGISFKGKRVFIKEKRTYTR